jgi:hypothetical protein
VVAARPEPRLRSHLVAGALALLGAAGCGPPAAPATESTAARFPDNPELAQALAEEGQKACTRACKRLAECAPPDAVEDCEPDCRGNLATGRAAPAVHYAACLAALSCDDIAQSLDDPLGPAAQCYVAAQRMLR